jgi:prophage antirepressor-like protein
MKNEVQVFQNEEFGEVRTTEVNGEIWFVAKDVAGALGYANQNEAVQDHVDIEDKLNSKTLPSFDLNLGQRGGWLINESGLYSLILYSKLPSAKRFKKWVTSEILPSIRKTGGYVQINREKEFLDNWLSRFSDETKNVMIKELTATNEKLQEERDNLAKDNAVYRGEVFDWGDRKRLNFAIRKLASLQNKSFGIVWNDFYRELSYRWGIDLKKRGGSPYIKHIQEKEWQYVLRTLTALCEDANTTLSEIMKNIRNDFKEEE